MADKIKATERALLLYGPSALVKAREHFVSIEEYEICDAINKAFDKFAVDPNTKMIEWKLSIMDLTGKAPEVAYKNLQEYVEMAIKMIEKNNT